MFVLLVSDGRWRIEIVISIIIIGINISSLDDKVFDICFKVHYPAI